MWLYVPTHQPNPNCPYLHLLVHVHLVAHSVWVAGHVRVVQKVQADANVDEAECHQRSDEGDQQQRQSVEAGALLAEVLPTGVLQLALMAKLDDASVQQQGQRDHGARQPDEEDSRVLVLLDPQNRPERIENGEISTRAMEK